MDGESSSSAPIVSSTSIGSMRLVRLLVGAGPSVDTKATRQLGEPGADRVVVPELVEMLVRAREHFLEDVFRVVLGQLESLDRIAYT